MARKFQVVKLKVFFDDQEHSAPEDWSWSGLLDGDAELLDYEPVGEVTESEEGEG